MMQKTETTWPKSHRNFTYYNTLLASGNSSNLGIPYGTESSNALFLMYVLLMLI